MVYSGRHTTVYASIKAPKGGKGTQHNEDREKKVWPPKDRKQNQKTFWLHTRNKQLALQKDHISTVQYRLKQVNKLDF